jgi:spoIIIJ-associated protein
MTGPMNPHDRRIVHLALQEDGRFKTRSRGEGTFKRVVISLKD